MSDEIISGGLGVFLEEHQDDIWVPIHSVNSPSRRGIYIDQGRVTDSAVNIQSSNTICVKQAGKKYNVNTVNHCIFCLRRITSNPEAITLANTTNYSASAELKQVPGAPSEYSTSAPPLLSALNNTWSNVQKGGYWSWDDDQGNSHQHFTKFTSFPKICRYCASEFSGICKLMSKLKAEINKLGVIIRESKKCGAYSWRAESFERTLKASAVDSQCISDTLQFLGIPQENRSPSSHSASYETWLLSEQPKEEETSHVHLDFHDEGSEDDASIECDDIDNDPNYVKEKEDAFSDSEDSESPTEEFDDDPLNDNKSELTHSLTRCPNFVEMSSTDSNIPPRSISTSEAPSQSDITIVKDPTTKRNKFACTINGCGKTSFWIEEIKIHQQKQHNRITEEESSSPQQHQPDNVCSICGKTFVNKSGVTAHIKNFHAKGKVAMVTCDLCKIHVLWKNIHEHVRAHVGEEYLIRCPNPNPGQCSFVCCTQRGLKAHLRQRKNCKRAIPDVNEKYLKPRDAFCNVCGEELANLLSLRVHLNNLHENQEPKGFPCPIQGCPRRFSCRQSVVLHIPSHINKLQSFDSQPCDVCKENIKCEEMEQHLKETHHLVQETIIKCLQCPFLFCDRTNLLDHLYEHRHIALFCDLCGNPDTTFYSHRDLRRHYFEVHQIGSKFLCEHCETEFFSASGLEKHLAKRHPAAAQPEEKPSKDPPGGCSSSSSAVASSDAVIAETKFKCDECDVAYKSKQYLTFHKITIHEGKFLPCKFCDQTFTSLPMKTRHEGKHRGRRGPVDLMKEMFPCQVSGCGKQLTSKYALKKHVSWAHEGQKSHVCEQCGKAYTDKSGLKSHVECVHMGVRNHRCDICGESFSSGTVLKRHKLIHSGDRAFVCQLCGQKFRYKEVLKRHVEAHERKGADFKPNGPMKQLRKRVDFQSKRKKVD